MLRFFAWGCGTLILLFALLCTLAVLLLSKVPKSYPLVAQPIPPTSGQGSLDGFDSPYLGHTGSWDGKGGAMFGRSKLADLERERRMGLRWTFMPVYWRAMEPRGPVDLSKEVPDEWKELDAFVIAAQKFKLNILMQAPVVGGNAGGPPEWAGRRKPGRSAPANMDAAAEFAAKLAVRYCPGGTLAQEQRWGTNFGVRAWELDNEPESYRTSWKEQAADYAEFATKVAAAIRKVDPQAVIVCPGIAGGGHGLVWLEAVLAGKPAPTHPGTGFSVGPITDVISFHCYEGLETALSKEDRTIETDFSDIRAVFEQSEKRFPGFEYSRKLDYWHTEGNFDFLGILSQARRAAWRFQFFTRAFAAGIRKVCVMDASPLEQTAIRAYIEALPNPFPMLPATGQVTVLSGRANAFVHPDTGQSGGRVWVVWAEAPSGNASVEIPVSHDRVTVIGVNGQKETKSSLHGKIRLLLKGDKKMAPGMLLLDRGPASSP